jgi:DNA-binding NarL/FixJ family response regulator
METAAEEKKIRVLLTDDHQVVLEGLALMLKKSKDISVVGFAKSEAELAIKAKQLQPDVVMLDVLMPNSNAFSSIKELKSKYPKVSIVCCSSVTEPDLVLQLVNSGINGYILKSISLAELQEAILKVSKGENYFSQPVTAIIVEAVRKQSSGKINNETAAQFTDKELEIIGLICREKTMKEIAKLLDINIRTLESTKLRIMKKMDVPNVAAAVYFALKNKLVDIHQLGI